MAYVIFITGMARFFSYLVASVSQGLASWKTALHIALLARSPWQLIKALLPVGLQGRMILNEAPSSASPIGVADGDIAQQLRQVCNQLKAKAYVADGGVDYANLEESPLFDELVLISQALRQLTPEDLPGPTQRLAFWINLYNVLMIQGVIVLGLKRSVMEVPSFFTSVGYEVGGHFFSPDDIEHGLLRGNAPHPVTNRRPFDDDDPRRQWGPEEIDPRIHFALVCVARSCPPIAFYSLDKIDDQLDQATANFIETNITVDDEHRQIILSEIFKFYEVDFGGRQGLIDFLSGRMEDPMGAPFEEALTQGYRWVYETYDWSLNSL